LRKPKIERRRTTTGRASVYSPGAGGGGAGYVMARQGRAKRHVESNICGEAGAWPVGAHAAISEALDALLDKRRRAPGRAMSPALAADAGLGQAASFSIEMLRPWPSGARACSESATGSPVAAPLPLLVPPPVPPRQPVGAHATEGQQCAQGCARTTRCIPSTGRRALAALSS